MSNQPRRQHVVPRSYLRGFTQSQDDKGKLWVYDVQRDKERTALPEDVAVWKDFYTLEDAPEDPYVVEKAFSKLEGAMPPILKGIQDTEALPSSCGDLDLLSEFMALQALRVPRTYRLLEGLVPAFADAFHRDLATDPKPIQAGAESDGIVIRDEQIAEALAAIEKGEVYVVPSKDGIIQAWLRQLSEMADLIRARQWCVVVTDDAHPLITSDAPVSAIWLNSEAARIAIDRGLKPALGLKGTALTFPLTRKVGLFGTFEGGLPAKISSLAAVNTLNAATATSAPQLIAGPNDQFTWFSRRKPSATFSDYRTVSLARLRQEKRARKRLDAKGSSIEAPSPDFSKLPKGINYS